MLAYQKRAAYLIIDGCEPPCACWELNVGPLEEQLVLLTVEQSLYPLYRYLVGNKKDYLWILYIVFCKTITERVLFSEAARTID